MFCDRCGAVVEANHRFCSQCGKEFAGAIGYPRQSRVQAHVRLLGILWLALSALNAVGAVVLYVLANTLFVHLPEMGAPRGTTEWLHPFLAVIAILIALKAGAGFAAGWGLLQREPWARIVTIILAFLSLFNVPFGTALGIYSLWVLLPAGSDEDYRQEASGAAA